VPRKQGSEGNFRVLFFCAICPDAPNDDSLGDELCRRARAGVSWACNRLEANMSPETKADLLRAVTDFYDVILKQF
jgi:hypothetical protein